MKINKLKQREKIDYVLIFLLLFIPNGYTLSIYSGTVRLLMCLGLVALISSRNPGLKKKFDKQSFLILIGVFCNISLTVLVNMEGLKQLIITFSFFLTAYIYTIYFCFDDFITKFIRVMSFLCIFSLILYFTAIFLPQLVMRLPTAHNVLDKSVYNALFSTITINDYLIRNQGIFWEPGAFQTFINIALIFNLFLIRENHMKNLIVFSTTLFTTYSTTGYIVGLVIVLAFILHSLSKKDQKRKKGMLSFVSIIIILLIVGIFFYNNLPNSAKYQLFGKVANHMENGNNSSTAVRINAIIIPLQEFIKNPIWGNGTLGMSEIALVSGYKMNTATIINWFAMFGIFMGLCMNYGLYKLCMKLECKKNIKTLLFVAFLLTLISEDYVRNPSILVFVFYGYNYIDHKKIVKLNKVISKPVTS